VSEQNPNLALWDQVQATDPNYTKKFEKGGFTGTAINGTYIAKRLTEAFGPCGKGWKMVIDDERIIPGPNSEQLHVIRGHLSYLHGGSWHDTSPQFGQTMLVQWVRPKSEGGTGYHRFDEEAPKKSVTDLMSKCASLLGIAADVHLGLYDDNKYINQVKAEFGEKVKSHPINDLQLKAVNDALTESGLSVRAFCKAFEIDALAALPSTRYDEALKDIAAFKAKKAAEAAAKKNPAAEGEKS